MHARTIAIVGVLAAMLLASLALAMPRKSRYAGPVSPVVFGKQTIPLRFSHVRHLERGATCATCHEAAAKSRSSLDNLLPTEAACDGCHAIDRNQPNKTVPPGRGPAACVTCHPAYDASSRHVPRVRIPVPNIKFSHKAHIDREIECKVCHGDFVKERVGLATRKQLPKMGLCLQCHNGRKAKKTCTTCHITDAGGYMKTAFATGKLKPSGTLRGAGHDMLFRTNHKAAARNDSKYCATCHRKRFCVDCHNGVIKPMDFHPNDYITLHVIDARRNTPDCSACHRTQSFCVQCHSRSGVTADRRTSEFRGPSTGVANRGYHPPGWVSFSGGLPQLGSRSLMHHSFQAQRNIKQCAACHREEFCKGCHTAEPGSFRVNPHPRGWVGSRRCNALLKRNKRMCLRCHTRINELGCNWRAAGALRQRLR